MLFTSFFVTLYAICKYNDPFQSKFEFFIGCYDNAWKIKTLILTCIRCHSNGFPMILAMSQINKTSGNLSKSGTYTIFMISNVKQLDYISLITIALIYGIVLYSFQSKLYENHVLFFFLFFFTLHGDKW